jgi:hypothetical protein
MREIVHIQAGQVTLLSLVPGLLALLFEFHREKLLIKASFAAKFWEVVCGECPGSALAAS